MSSVGVTSDSGRSGKKGRTGSGPKEHLPLEVAVHIPYEWTGKGIPDWKSLVRVTALYDMAIPPSVNERARASLRAQADEKSRGLPFYAKRVDGSGKRPITSKEYNPNACLMAADAKSGIAELRRAGFQLYLAKYKRLRREMGKELE